MGFNGSFNSDYLRMKNNIIKINAFYVVKI